MTEEHKTMIGSLIGEASEYNLSRIKEIVKEYDGPQPNGCFCKQYIRDNYLIKVKEWFEQYE